MKHVARWVAIGVAIVVAAFAVVLAMQVGDDPRAATNERPLLGRPAPTISLPLLDGSGTVTTDDLAGKVVMVNFWNSWCIPCEEELPALEAFFDRHADEPDFVMLGILRAEEPRPARKAAKRDGIGWTLVDDPDEEASLAFGTRGQPETFAITAGGRIVGTQIGPATVRDLEELLAAARGSR